GLAAVDPRCQRWLAIDVDGDGIDELVGAPLSCAADRALVVVHVAPGDPRATRTPLAAVADAIAADIDGDGHTDLVVVGDSSQILWGVDPARASALPPGQAVAVIGADAGPRPRLVVLDRGAITVVDVLGHA